MKGSYCSKWTKYLYSSKILKSDPSKKGAKQRNGDGENLGVTDRGRGTHRYGVAESGRQSGGGPWPFEGYEAGLSFLWLAFRTGHKSRAHCFSSRSLPLLLIRLPDVYSLPSVAGEISGRTDICYYRYFGSSTFRLNVRNNFNVYLTAAFLSPERANSEARATKKIRICARGDRSPFFGTGQPSHTASIYLPCLPAAPTRWPKLTLITYRGHQGRATFCPRLVKHVYRTFQPRTGVKKKYGSSRSVSPNPFPAAFLSSRYSSRGTEAPRLSFVPEEGGGRRAINVAILISWVRVILIVRNFFNGFVEWKRRIKFATINKYFWEIIGD